ncbi:RNA 2',3'-cyclic phosphodiesterase [compost metagenome]
MNGSESLYLIALLPDATVTQEVNELKVLFAENFNTRKGQHIIPHITLQPPFGMTHEAMSQLVNNLIQFSEEEQPLQIQLDGFGYFLNPRSDVIFIKPVYNPLLQRFHRHLMCFLRKNGFSVSDTSKRFNPHITIAYRDLKREETLKAWPLLENQPYLREFDVNEFYLLKHNGKTWQKYASFPLSNISLLIN